jgi:hypothetical protein
MDAKQSVDSFRVHFLKARSCIDLRRMIVAGLRNELDWQPCNKAAMARTLLVDSHLDFWAQIGFHILV